MYNLAMANKIISKPLPILFHCPYVESYARNQLHNLIIDTEQPPFEEDTAL